MRRKIQVFTLLTISLWFGAACANGGGANDRVDKGDLSSDGEWPIKEEGSINEFEESFGESFIGEESQLYGDFMPSLKFQNGFEEEMDLDAVRNELGHLCLFIDVDNDIEFIKAKRISNLKRVTDSTNKPAKSDVYTALNEGMEVLVKKKKFLRGAVDEIAALFKLRGVTNISEILECEVESGFIYSTHKKLFATLDSEAAVKLISKKTFLEKIDLYIGLARGLEKIHKRGLVKHNVMPSKIMINEDGTGLLYTGFDGNKHSGGSQGESWDHMTPPEYYKNGDFSDNASSDSWHFTLAILETHLGSENVFPINFSNDIAFSNFDENSYNELKSNIERSTKAYIIPNEQCESLGVSKFLEVMLNGLAYEVEDRWLPDNIANGLIEVAGLCKQSERDLPVLALDRKSVTDLSKKPNEVSDNEFDENLQVSIILPFEEDRNESPEKSARLSINSKSNADSLMYSEFDISPSKEKNSKNHSPSKWENRKKMKSPSSEEIYLDDSLNFELSRVSEASEISNQKNPPGFVDDMSLDNQHDLNSLDRNKESWKINQALNDTPVGKWKKKSSKGHPLWDEEELNNVKKWNKKKKVADPKIDGGAQSSKASIEQILLKKHIEEDIRGTAFDPPSPKFKPYTSDEAAKEYKKPQETPKKLQNLHELNSPGAKQDVIVNRQNSPTPHNKLKIMQNFKLRKVPPIITDQLAANKRYPINPPMVFSPNNHHNRNSPQGPTLENRRAEINSPGRIAVRANTPQPRDNRKVQESPIQRNTDKPLANKKNTPNSVEKNIFREEKNLYNKGFSPRLMHNIRAHPHKVEGQDGNIFRADSRLRKILGQDSPLVNHPKEFVLNIGKDPRRDGLVRHPIYIENHRSPDQVKPETKNPKNIDNFKKKPFKRLLLVI
jgi:hypothetical protein